MKYPKVLISKAIREAGSVALLARSIGYSRGGVNRWREEGRKYLPELAAWRYQYGREQ